MKGRRCITLYTPDQLHTFCPSCAADECALLPLYLACSYDDANGWSPWRLEAHGGRSCLVGITLNPRALQDLDASHHITRPATPPQWGEDFF